MAETFKFPSQSEAGVIRVVTWEDDGRMKCDCPGWKTKRNDLPFSCSHLGRVADLKGIALEIRGDFVYMYADDVQAPPLPQPLTKSAERPPKPMLASAMTDDLKGEAFDAKYGNENWVLERKLDGHRCTMIVRGGQVWPYSRPQKGKPANLRDDVPGRVLKVMASLPDGVYDGELCAQGGKARNVRQKNSFKIYVVFDVLILEGKSLMSEPLQVRRKALRKVLKRMVDENPDQRAVSTVEQVKPSWAKVEEIWAEGGEGAVIKRVGSTYQAGARSSDWIKVKPERAAELRIVGYEEGKSGPFSTVLLVDKEGVKASVKTLNSGWLRKLAANPNKYIGMTMVVAYVERTPSGAYQNIRWDHVLEDD